MAKIIIDKQGSKFYFQGDGIYHRLDGPSIIKKSGFFQHMLFNTITNNDGPSVFRPNGSYIWYDGGYWSRNGGPAYDVPNGYKRWYQLGAFKCPTL